MYQLDIIKVKTRDEKIYKTRTDCKRIRACDLERFAPYETELNFA